jgi:hypothetical protein
MPSLRSDDRYLKHDLPRLCQGDILRDLELVEWGAVVGAEPQQQINLTKRALPYAVVLSQECDLYQDLQNRNDLAKPTQDKFLHSVLLGPAYPAQSVREGTHLEALQVKCERLNKDRWKSVLHNSDPRYHYLPAAEALQIPDLVLDFKHFITAPRSILLDLKRDAYLASLGQLFRDSLSQRFANFLARIALPEAEEEKQEAAAAQAAAPAAAEG